MSELGNTTPVTRRRFLAALGAGALALAGCNVPATPNSDRQRFATWQAKPRVETAGWTDPTPTPSEASEYIRTHAEDPYTLIEKQLQSGVRLVTINWPHCLPDETRSETFSATLINRLIQKKLVDTVYLELKEEEQIRLDGFRQTGDKSKLVFTGCEAGSELIPVIEAANPISVKAIDSQRLHAVEHRKSEGKQLSNDKEAIGRDTYMRMRIAEDLNAFSSRRAIFFAGEFHTRLIPDDQEARGTSLATFGLPQNQVYAVSQVHLRAEDYAITSDPLVQVARQSGLPENSVFGIGDLSQTSPIGRLETLYPRQATKASGWFRHGELFNAVVLHT